MAIDLKLFQERYDIDPTIGCLTQCADTLPPPFDEWVEVGKRLPELLVAGTVRDEISRLTEKTLEQPLNPPEARLFKRTADHLASGWVWGAEPAATSIPWPLSPVLVDLGECLGTKPILSYWTFILCNWELIDPLGPMEPENIEIQQYFLRTEHARWFNAIHVAIEATEARLPSLLMELHYARIADDVERMVELLRECAQILERGNAYLRRMPEHCERGAYFSLVRPYIQGFHRHPVIYRGFWKDKPQDFWGESGSQSLLMPSLDCGFSISHRSDGEFAQYLREMPDYMPWGHRRYLHDLALLTQRGEESLYLYALGCRGTYPELCQELHRCVMLMVEFSEIHFGYPKTYIVDQADRATEHNRSDTGTGGMPPLKYLWEHVLDRRRYADSLL